ncbi:cuticle protein [Holotrichia oblita]|uniref:Cuticle protein n=1 Tax=Holotrichia oblita TaxID=644536 RepID=A0ACB9SN69_HOLOL|nr:cuticle protein [Holotrichia oblita]
MFKVLALFCLVGACIAAPADVVPIVSQSSDVQPDGSYNYRYKRMLIFETGDGTAIEQHGSVKTVDNEAAIVAEGKFAYKAPDGTDYSVTYTADENGYRPEGAHIPAIPAAIARALEYIAAHPEQNGAV